MQFSFGVCLKLFSGTILAAVMTSSALGEEMTLEFIGQRIIPHEYKYKDTVVGGLSALDYNPETDRFVAICDDRSSKNPARFYELNLTFDQNSFQGWQITDVNFMKRPDGTVFPKPEIMGKSLVDPEALKLSPTGDSYFWTSEGHAKYGVNPFIREMGPHGGYRRDFTVPDKYLVAENKGIRDNLAFEAMTLNQDRQSITVSTEGPLIQDGPEATVDHGANVRFLHLNIATGEPTHEYVYPVEPVHGEALPIGNFSVNGVVDILAVSDTEYLVVERSFSAGVGLSVRLYLADFTGATDVLALDSLKDVPYKVARKRLLLDLGTLGVAIDNIEGMTFGKTLKDGRRSLIMISDDNFRSAQVTQMRLFAVGSRTPPPPHQK